MTYRDDDDAARARADALQVDLDQTQDELAATKQKLAAAEAEKIRLADEVERAKRAPPKSVVEPSPSPEIVQRAGGSKLAGGVIISIFAIIVVALAANKKARNSAYTPPRQCTVNTLPQGAEIISLCTNDTQEMMNSALGSQAARLQIPSTFEMHRGTSPLTKSSTDWIMDSVICKGSMIARLPGFDDTPVDQPRGEPCESLTKLKAPAN